MSSTGKDEHLIFIQNPPSTYYYFVYDDDEEDDNVVGLIKPTPKSVDTLKDEIINEDVVDTKGYDVLEAIEHENVQICDDL